MVNAARDRIRKHVRYSEVGAEWGSREMMAREEETGRKPDREFLRDAMARLDPNDRVTVALLVTGGFSQAEAAEILEIAPGTVAWRMTEIRKRLSDMAAMAGEVA